MSVDLSPGTSSNSGYEHEELLVTFNPPLYLQRQIWLLSTLTRHKVLDIGCGEGNLLQCLTEPSIARIPPENFQTLDELYIHTVHGLDPSIIDLECTAKRLAPINTEANNAATVTETRTVSAANEEYVWRPFQAPRWTALHVHLWNGGFENLNYDAFGGDRVDAFAATEVIEHLTPDIFPLFAPVLLGYYRPRLVLLTTPNYTYNQRFRPPDVSPSTGYPDPTRRTNRVFRHHDHKFEWTAEEWSAYCTTIAAEYGYKVEVGGIGKAVEPDPWNREDVLGYATQTAIFLRMDNQIVDVPSIVQSIQALEPDLLITHTHLPHSLSTSEDLTISPCSVGIFKTVREAFMDNFCETLSFREIWRTRAVALACRGDVKHLHQVFQTGNFDIDEWKVKDNAENGWKIEITWERFEAPPVPDDSVNSITTLIEPEDADEMVLYDDDGGYEPQVERHTYQSPVEKDVPNVWSIVDEGWSSPRML